MSGGVDSSVAAALLQRAGHEVIGCFMRLGSPGEEVSRLVPDDDGAGAACDPVHLGHRGCCSVGDAADARVVAGMLGIPLYVLSFRREFSRIIDYFVDEYNAGRTPNPCVRCNDWLKFGRLHEHAEEVGADFVATGHYARIGRADDGRGDGHSTLLRGVDVRKDQSYVLFGIRRDRLDRTLLPIGDIEKPRVRAIAEELGLPVFNKPDSQEICFVPDDDYAGFVRRRTPEAFAPGAILDRDGAVVGEHRGHQHFTIGQRRRLGLRPTSESSVPLYVIGKDPQANTIIVGSRTETATRTCVARECNWLIDAPRPGAAFACRAQYRAHGEAVAATVTVTDTDDADASLEITFDEPQLAVAPGQAVVLYDGPRVLGGGWIASPTP